MNHRQAKFRSRPGRPEQVTDTLAALDLTLDTATFDRIEHAVPAGAAAGDRYPTMAMADLDSER
ncbi:MAG: hypothetical protein ACR2JK_07340 [Geodermatophilaceae bacterium]